MTGPDRERLSPCVGSTLRMVSRAVTQLYDDILWPSGRRVTQSIDTTCPSDGASPAGAAGRLT
jgi:hypothetical protein